MRIQAALAIALLMSTGAQAQNFSQTFQGGFGNSQVTFQSGGLNLSATAQAGSNNSSTTIQNGTGNLSSIVQIGEGYNQVSVQAGNNNGFSSLQVQTRPEAGSFVSVRTGGNGNLSITNYVEVN